MKVGVLGYGSIGKRHAKNLIALGHEVITHDPAEALSAKREHVLRVADAIVIASPTPQHFQDIYDCVEAGRPMLIEKPLIHPDQKALLGVISKLGTSGLPAFMGFNLRFHACVQKAQEWLPRIGKPYLAQFTVAQKTTKPEYLRDGVISNWASHELDIIRYLLGPCHIERCKVDQSDSEAEITLAHDGGCPRTTLRADYLTDPEVRRFLIQGSNGKLKVDLVRRTVEIDHTITGEIFKAKDTWVLNYISEMKDWVGAIQGRPGLCADWTDGVEVARLVIQAREIGGL